MRERPCHRAKRIVRTFLALSCVRQWLRPWLHRATYPEPQRPLAVQFVRNTPCAVAQGHNNLNNHIVHVPTPALFFVGRGHLLHTFGVSFIF
jgi:hypothetical protein